jgi:signal transduction histidine kinase
MVPPAQMKRAKLEFLLVLITGVVVLAVAWVTYLAWQKLTALDGPSAPESVAVLRRYLITCIVTAPVLIGLAARLAYTAVVRLITSWAHSQTALQRQEKLAALASLVTGVAHEIGNPLTVIKVRLHGLRRSLLEGASGYEDAAAIHRETDRLEQVIRDLLRIARPPVPRPERLEAGMLFARVKERLEPRLDRWDISLSVDLPKPVWIVADPQQIEEVLVSLVQNSAESIQREGRIILRATRLVGSKPATVIEVADTGMGIAPEIQSRLFDPFFSTKQGSRGLGLSFATRIVEEHGGSLGFESRLGHGAVFTVTIPDCRMPSSDSKRVSPP